MALNLEFSLNRSTGELSLSNAFRNRYLLPSVFSGEVLFFKIFLVQPDPSNGDGYLRLIPSTGLAVKIAIGNDSGVLNSADLVAQPDDSFAGTLPLNITAIDDLFTSQSNPVDRTLEIQVTDTIGPSKAQFPITIKKGMITSTTVAVAAPDEGLSKAEAAELYLPLRSTVPGRGFILTDDAGIEFLVSVQAGELKLSQIA